MLGYFNWEKKRGEVGGSPPIVTVRVISSDPPCKDDNARFTTVTLEAFSDQVLIRYECL